MKTRKWYGWVILAGVLFSLYYVRNASYDVVYSDYIRLVNNYLPDVWNPDKFFVPDILTRIPVTYLARIVNTSLFGYSLAFDQVLGVLCLGLGAGAVTLYCVEEKISAPWFLTIMALLFSLNKWEMMVNGSGWAHFLAFAGFYYHYLVVDRVWTGREKKGDRARLLWIPWAVILGAAGQYCAVYTAVLLLAYGFMTIWKRLREKRWTREFALPALSAAAPFALYLWSYSYSVEDHAGMQQLSLISQLLDTPGYFARFLLKSLESLVVGVEAAQELFTGNAPYQILGFLVAAAYLLALWLQYRMRLYEESLFPLMLIAAGAMNHALILLTRWSFLIEDYGMSARYTPQFLFGILGILLTFALAGRHIRAGRAWKTAVFAAFALMFLAGNAATTKRELHMAPYRKNACMERAQVALDYRQKTDDELREKFEYRMNEENSGAEVRRALEILDEQNWNVFRRR